MKLPKKTTKNFSNSWPNDLKTCPQPDILQLLGFWKCLKSGQKSSPPPGDLAILKQDHKF